MKVLLLNQIPEVNNKYTFSLASALKKQGISIAVCGIDSDDYSAYTDIPHISIFEGYSNISSSVGKVRSYYRSWKRVFDYCCENKIEIVHIQWYIFSPIDWLFEKRLKMHGMTVITTIHDLLPFNKRIYDYHFHKKIYSHADMVISQAKMNEEQLISDFDVRKERITYIPHGHYMEYAEAVDKNIAREHLGIDKKRQMILFFGQIKKVKGVDVLIRAMSKVAQKYPDSLCTIAGKVWKDDYSAYQNLIDELGLSNNIRSDIKFIPDEDIKYYFNAADIVALPYLQIYQSGVVLLAYAYNKPLVATTEGEFLTVVKNNETGKLVPAGDSDKLAEAIIWYLDNPDKAAEYAEEGRNDISVRLSWDSIGKQVKTAYETALKNSDKV